MVTLPWDLTAVEPQARENTRFFESGCPTSIRPVRRRLLAAPVSTRAVNSLF